MAAKTAAAHGEVPCPDPSVHEKSSQLSNQASTAALYVTQSDRSSTPGSSANNGNPLGPDGKLSSRSAATSLKYAKAQDLPSFPSRGGNQSAAGAAAMLAKDHKMKELWQPEASSAGSKAAFLAAKDGGKVDAIYSPHATSAGNSAATLAMRNKTLSPNIDRGYTDAGHKNSLLAATQSVRAGRQRAGSTPVAPPPLYPDSQNKTKNALNAATVSHRQSTKHIDGWNSDANQAARVKNMHMDKEMFTEHPPVEPELDEQRHQAALRASAVSMAKSMYDYQERNRLANEQDETSSIDLGSAGANTAHQRGQTTTQPDIKEEAMRYIHLQDAAHKLAQERLAKVDKEMENERYREYYGYGEQKSPKKPNRMSMRNGVSGGRSRKRASSEPNPDFSDSDDEEQARRIRTQMSQLSTNLNTVDKKQQQSDRARVLAAAEQRVHQRMHDMDAKVFMDTGKPSPAMMEEWETKAREKAERDREMRQQNPGKTHIGGGKFMDDSAIEAIAAARLKPTLDEIDATATKRRERDVSMERRRDEAHTREMDEKMQGEQQKAEFRRIREQDKAAAKREKEEKKAAQRQEKEEARARKSEDKRKSREQKRDFEMAGVGAGGAAAAAGVAAAEIEDPDKTDGEDGGERDITLNTQDQTKDEPKEKGGRSMFDRIASRLKRQGKEGEKKDEPVAATAPAAAVFADDEHKAGAEDAAPATDKDMADLATAVQDEQAEGQAEKDRQDIATAVQDERAEGVAAEQHRGLGARSEPTGGLYIPAEEYKGNGEESGMLDKPAVVAPAPEEDEDEDEDSLYADPEDEDENRGRSKNVDALLGAGAGVAAAGAATLAATATLGEEEEKRDDVSSLSATDDDEDEDEPEQQQASGLYSVPTDHDGQYNFAMASPGPRRPVDLERHISTIQDSSGEEEESDDLEDSDEDDEYFGRAGTTTREQELGVGAGAAAVGAGAGAVAAEEKLERPKEAAPAHAVQREVQATPAAAAATSEQKPAEGQHSSTKVKTSHWIDESSGIVQTAPVHDERPSPVSPLPADEEGNLFMVKKGDDFVVVPPEEGKQTEEKVRGASASALAPAPAAAAAVSAPPAPAAPAPTVKTGPSASDEKEKEKNDGKEHKGLRGFISKLKGKSKAEQRLHKDPPPGRNTTETKHFEGGSKLTKPNKGDDTITPVTTTSAGRRAEQGAHVGTDGPIGDTKHVSGIGGDPRAASPSSFTRGEGNAKELDDVSSSGLDEEDLGRGRATNRAEEGPDGSDDHDQFEEARDHFDENLAPPPAFGGQMKSESPVRETKFQEQF